MEAVQLSAQHPRASSRVRLEPELREALIRRAKRDHETTSSVLRKALRSYLQLH